MNRTTLIAILAAVTSGGPSLAGELLPTGEPYLPDAPISWAVTSSLPTTVLVCKAAPRAFSQTVVSNAMEIGSFKLINRMPWADKSALHFRDNRKNFTRSLTISPDQGLISYFDKSAEGTPVRRVPSAESLDGLALNYLIRLGGDTNQVLPKRRIPREGTTTSYDKPGGREISKEVYKRGATLDRQVEGIEDLGSSFLIDFGNDSKPSWFEFKWRNLQPKQRFPTPKPEQIVRWIKAGRAVIPPSALDPGPVAPVAPKSITITKVRLCYAGKSTGELVYPFAQLELVADVGNNSKLPFYLNCPVIDVELGK